MTDFDGRDYPAPPVPTGHVEPCPRRVRGVFGGRLLFETVGTRYVWEFPYYPQYYVPLADIDTAALVDEHVEQTTARGTARQHGMRRGDVHRPESALVFGASAHELLRGTVRFSWDALDAWFEEDEEVFVHPRSPYTRVDALRSHRHVRVELDGVLLAETHSPVLVFETGLPTRYYFDRFDVVLSELVASETLTRCPYKGTTSAYWSVRAAGGADGPVDEARRDLAWSYDFPTRQLLPVTGMVALYNEKVDITVDGVPLPRPHTKFS